MMGKIRPLWLAVWLFAGVLHLSYCLVSGFVVGTSKRASSPLRMTDSDDSSTRKKAPLPIRRALLASTVLAGAQLFVAQAYSPPGFKRIPTQFIAALGDPKASKGTEAKEWGLWSVDPGPRGVFLKDFKSLETNGGKAPAGWTFNNNDWWLEEHGLIMEAPDFPIKPGRYLVTGGRMVTTVLTITEAGGWSLEKGELYDVTHLPCRSARYKPNSGKGSPATANRRDFPVSPGAEMPSVEGCDKQDYAVLFVIGLEDQGSSSSKDL
mmetsp:Transcript_15390/g.26081  ORF Transcript_15390/g.26081 Transcript_15390/m.26081 type:complete len:265 (-) Transcript_15390:82-876(-)